MKYMKTKNLFTAQKLYMTPKEQSRQKTIKLMPLIPIVMGLLIIIPSLGNATAFASSIFMLINMIFLAVVLAIVPKVFNERYIKMLSAEQRQSIESECLKAPHYEGLMVTGEVLIYFMPMIIILPIQNLVWIYPVEEVHRKGVIEKVFYTILAVSADGRAYTLLRENMDKERVSRSMDFLAEQLKTKRPHLIMGYSKELDMVAKKDFDRRSFCRWICLRLDGNNRN